MLPLFLLQPIAPKDYKFDVDAMKMINDVLRSLMVTGYTFYAINCVCITCNGCAPHKHPHVLPVLAIEHLMGENNRFLLSMQWGQACSLRDLIYGQVRRKMKGDW